MSYRRYPLSSRPRTEGPFRRGFLKHIILHYLEERPRHGYEIIKALEERFHGLYVPSAGSVYPTLQMLGELGFVTSVEQEGKRVYTITEAGQRFIAEHKDQQKGILEHLGWVSPENIGDLGRTLGEFDKLAELLSRGIRRLDTGKLEQLRRVISRAHEDMEGILRTQAPK
ncbi:MAG: PadR family transcriptional regulator [Chloroflexi bacterium]|nr:PadR family transcriptional regulator [Chloroflexota bacterium]